VNSHILIELDKSIISLAEVVLMGMFPEIDEKKTIANVKNYFDKDFQRLKAQTHMDLKSL